MQITNQQAQIEALTGAGRAAPRSAVKTTFSPFEEEEEETQSRGASPSGSQQLRAAGAASSLGRSSAAPHRSIKNPLAVVPSAPASLLHFPPAPPHVDSNTLYMARVIMSQQGRSVPRSIKLPTLPAVQVLGDPNNCTKDGLAYRSWEQLVKLALLAQNCTQLMTDAPP